MASKAVLQNTNSSDPAIPSAVYRPGARNKGERRAGGLEWGICVLVSVIRTWKEPMAMFI